MEKIITLANRLAESILMDWDKEEVIKLAKEVAVACHENIEFISLVKRMREAQMDKAIVEARVRFKHEERLEITEEDNKLYASAIDKAVVLEDEVDEYLEKMEL